MEKPRQLGLWPEKPFEAEPVGDQKLKAASTGEESQLPQNALPGMEGAHLCTRLLETVDKFNESPKALILLTLRFAMRDSPTMFDHQTI